MTLQEFKTANAITSLNLYNSTKSDRLVGSYVNKEGKEQTVISTSGFDKTQPVFVYEVDTVDESTGEMTHLKVLSNKEPKQPDVVL